MKQITPVFIFVSLLWTAVCGQDKGTEVDPGFTRDSMIYKTIDGMALQVDLYYATGALERTGNPAIAFFHGGGWAYGSPEEFREACLRYAGQGFVTFSFQYRLSVKEDGSVPHPTITPVECVKDARSAIRWLREHAESLHIDPRRIVACGQSAGGQLALCTAMPIGVDESSDNLEISPVPAAIILYSSNVNTLEAWADRLMGERRDEIWSISPHHSLGPGLPPTIAFHGEEDCMVPIWVVRHFEQKALSLGNDFELVTFEGRKHYLGEDDPVYGRYYDEGIFERTDRFLREKVLMDP